MASKLNDICKLCSLARPQESILTEKVIKLEEVSGHSIDTLISLF